MSSRKHTTLNQNRINVDSTSTWRWINVSSVLIKVCVPSGFKSSTNMNTVLYAFTETFRHMYIMSKWCHTLAGATSKRRHFDTVYPLRAIERISYCMILINWNNENKRTLSNPWNMFYLLLAKKPGEATAARRGSALDAVIGQRPNSGNPKKTSKPDDDYV